MTTIDRPHATSNGTMHEEHLEIIDQEVRLNYRKYLGRFASQEDLFQHAVVESIRKGILELDMSYFRISVRNLLRDYNDKMQVRDRIRKSPYSIKIAIEDRGSDLVDAACDISKLYKSEFWLELDEFNRMLFLEYAFECRCQAEIADKYKLTRRQVYRKISHVRNRLSEFFSL